MNNKVLIVEDHFVEANNLKLILEKAGYSVCGIARSFNSALDFVNMEKPDLVLLDIFLDGPLTGIDLAEKLRQKKIGFVYLSANSNKETLDLAKVTRPYGFLVKPFREKDVLVMLDIAWYLHEQNQRSLGHRDRMFDGNSKLSNYDTGRKNHGGIISQNPAMLHILDLVQTVAATDTSVLILGESGTGKELIAQTIHKLSKRHASTLVTVNCASLPATLIESELFGHEKGAFTGAAERRVGKFERAAGSSIFLDEICEMPLDLQSKLLRVLQEREIERVGGSHTIRTDVRVIAATNRNPEQEVAEGKFRMDLYYRLNVFPIQLPALRERKEDILLLATFFVDKFSTLLGRKITGLSTHAESQLLQYDWPGNIRELENLMERSVLLCSKSIISNVAMPMITKKEVKLNAVDVHADSKIKTMEETERDHILSALKICNGKIAGWNGAAELLNMHSSTLNSRIKKLNIRKMDNWV